MIAQRRFADLFSGAGFPLHGHRPGVHAPAAACRARNASFALVLVTACALQPSGTARSAEPRHAIAMHGEPALPSDFVHFPYANPAAPKGGRLVQGVGGTFDSLNPYIVKGLPAHGLRGPFLSDVLSGHVVERLMVRGYDEPFTLYGLLAKTVETDAERSYVVFELNPLALFSDGQAVTADDVIFSWQLLRDKGRPNYRYYYAKVTRAERLGVRTVRFDLAAAHDRELALILGLMPILPKHATSVESFEETSLVPLVGSGPYIIAQVDPGKSLVLKRNDAYWGRELAVNRGFWNFDEIRFDYYREANTYHEAFKRGLFDMRGESDPGRWQTIYDFPAVRDGRVVKEAFVTALPKASSYFVFNTRRAVFADIRVREAISLLFDFEWMNRSYFFNLYRRTGSFFEGSELSAHGRPADARERALLAPFAEAVRPDVLEGTWSPPVSDGSGRDRNLLKRALELLRAAGYELRGTELVDRRNGRRLSFEIMLSNRDDERIASLFAQSLRRAGVAMQIRPVDAVQYETRRIAFDFDMIINRWDESLSPGNEQAFYWSSAAADQNGSRNYMGAKSAGVDAMIDALLNATSRDDVVTAVRALDRVLISGQYVVPLFHLPEQWMARWTRIQRPARSSLSGPVPETWWEERQERR
ncbi:MAG: extracellular solute-binding protein [Xanthobacteraceae bacterium]